jgi:hypothetical protein
MSLWATLRRHLLDPKDERAASDELRDISKWWLEFARHVVAVAGLQLLAEASGDVLLRGVAFLAYSALFVYCFSYVQWVVPNVFPSFKNQNIRALILLAILICVGGAGYYLIDAGLRKVIGEIARLQKTPLARTPVERCLIEAAVPRSSERYQYLNLSNVIFVHCPQIDFTLG